MKKRLFFMISFLFLTSIIWAQKTRPQNLANDNTASFATRKVYYDGVLYIQLKPAYRKSKLKAKDVSMDSEAPFLKKYKAKLGLKKLEKPFFFAKNPNLEFTYRLYYDKAIDAQKVMHRLQSEPEIAYVERVPIEYIPEHFNKVVVHAKRVKRTKKAKTTVDDPYYGDAIPIPLTSGNTLTFGTKWFLDQIKAPQAWKLFTPQANNPIKVAIVDGAVYKDHEDLNIVQSYDAETKSNNSNPPTSGDAYEWSHGTHCAGLVSAVTNNTKGIPSIGQNLQLIGVKTAQNSDGSLVYFFDGLIYAIEQTDAKVLSLSVGSYAYSLTEQNIINEAYNKDIVILAAASNDNITNKSYPAAYEHVIAVGSVTYNDTKSNFSNYGDWVDIMSPGGNTADSLYLLLSTTFVDASDAGMGIAANQSGINGHMIKGKYHMMAGTSMATPVAAGLVGLMRAANPDLNADQIEAILKRTCDNIDAQNPDYLGLIGAGRIDAEKAIQTVMNGNQLISVIGYTSLEIAPGQSLTFTDKSLGSPTSWNWTFEGPETLSSSDQNPSIKFNMVGDYSVRLVVSNGTTEDTTYLSQKVKVGTSTSIDLEATGFSTASRGITFISVADKNTVWALAYDGADPTKYIQEFSLTTDGGKTWTAKKFGLSSNLAPSMIFALDSNTAWAPFFDSGDPGTGKAGIYKTVDGGNTWKQQSSASFSGTSSFPNVVYFWNANDGVCMGDPESGYFEIYTTSDGGANWTRAANSGNVLNSNSTDEYGTVGYYSVADDGTFFFNTNKGRIFKTSDKGATWQAIETPVKGSSKIAFSSSNYGIIVDLDSKSAYFTEDGGTNWAALKYSGEFFVNHFQYVQGSKNMFASAGANSDKDELGLTFSRDGGNTWIDVPELTEQQCLALGFFDITTGWIGQFSQDASNGGMIRYNGPNTFAEFISDREAACSDASNSITFSDKTSTGSNNPSYEWNFGKDATPATANTVGPHTVKYSTEGVREVSLTVNGVYTVKHTIKVTSPAFMGTASIDTNRICQWASVHLSLDSVKGDIQWQVSVLNKDNFVNSESASATAKEFYSAPVEDTSYYRAKVFTEGCDALYSTIFKVDISRITSDYTWQRDSMTVTFTDASKNADSYLWDFGDGTNSTEASPSHRFNDEKDYTVKQIVTNSDACKDSSTQAVQVHVTGIASNLQKGELKIYPNPNNGQFSIELSGVPISSINIRIISLDGKQILAKKVYGAKSYINISHYKKGIYFLHIDTEFGSVIKKIIIQ